MATFERRSPRIRVQSQDDVHRQGLRDLSEDGLFVATTELMAVGTRVQFELRLPRWRSTLHIMGKVVRVEAGGPGVEPGMAISFDSLDSESRRRLRRLIDSLGNPPEEEAAPTENRLVSLQRQLDQERALVRDLEREVKSLQKRLAESETARAEAISKRETVPLDLATKQELEQVRARLADSEQARADADEEAEELRSRLSVLLEDEAAARSEATTSKIQLDETNHLLERAGDVLKRIRELTNHHLGTGLDSIAATAGKSASPVAPGMVDRKAFSRLVLKGQQLAPEPSLLPEAISDPSERRVAELVAVDADLDEIVAGSGLDPHHLFDVLYGFYEAGLVSFA